MTTTANDVFAYIEQQLPGVEVGGDMKLCKLAYYAQAWHLAWEGRPLFDERIEAWKHGPVPVATYSARRYGDAQPAKPLSAEQRSVVDAIIGHYGKMDPMRLAELTHKELPWREARGSLPEGAYSREEISKSSMRRYYVEVSMRGGEVPRRVSQHTPAPMDQVLALAEEELPRWAGTLARLAEK